MSFAKLCRTRMHTPSNARIDQVQPRKNLPSLVVSCTCSWVFYGDTFHHLIPPEFWLKSWTFTFAWMKFLFILAFACSSQLHKQSHDTTSRIAFTFQSHDIHCVFKPCQKCLSCNCILLPGAHGSFAPK